MSDNDSFSENPFLALNAKLFPDKSKAGNTPSTGLKLRPQKRAARRSALKGAAQEETFASADRRAEDADDERLFLQAVNRAQPAVQSGARLERGFSLEERCVLPRDKNRKKDRKSDKKNLSASPMASTGGGSGKKQDSMEDAGALQEEESAKSIAKALDEDAEAFLRAMGQVSPLQARGREVTPEPTRGTPPPQGELSLQDFMDGKLEFALSFTDEYLEGHVVGLDQMTMNKLRAGSLSPEAHLDLHGLNAAQAFEALRGFLRGCWYKGLRTVLVVPGRGRNSPDGMGVLREKLQNWLTQEPFKRVVLAFCTAQPHDGGPGSVYVLLRKYRKKGRIYWERMPADADLY